MNKTVKQASIKKVILKIYAQIRGNKNNLRRLKLFSKSLNTISENKFIKGNRLTCCSLLQDWARISPK